MSLKCLGLDVSATHTTAQHELGLVVADPANPQNRYRYVQADDAITAYDAVVFDFALGGSGTAANAPWIVTRSGDAAKVVGIAQVSIAAGSFGFILIEGEGIVQAETAVAQGDRLGHYTSASVAGELKTQGSTAVNPTKADFDQAVGSFVQVIATEAEGATSAGFASVVVF